MTTKKKVLIGLGLVLLAYGALVFGRILYFESAEQTEAQVAKIHATKLTLADVEGKSLQPDPGAEADKTVAGVDANKNGIRDDVELAIFAEYPNSAKTRAVLLQYALALQMEMTQPLVNTGTVVAVAQEKSKAAMCIAELTSRADLENFAKVTQGLTTFVKSAQLNNQPRDDAQRDFYTRLDSYSSLDETCDLDLSVFSN